MEGLEDEMSGVLRPFVCLSVQTFRFFQLIIPPPPSYLPLILLNWPIKWQKIAKNARQRK